MRYWGFNKMKIHIWSRFQRPSSHIIWNLTVGFHEGHHLMWYPKGFKLRIGLKTYPILTFFLYPPNIGKDPLYQMCEVIFFKNTRKYIYLVCRELAHVAKSYVGGIGILICCFPHMPFFFSFKIFPAHMPFFSFFFLLFPNFQFQLASFDSIFIHVFGRFLGPCSLKCPKISLIHRQVFFPILEVR